MAKIHVAYGDDFLFGPVEASLMPDDVSEEDFEEVKAKNKVEKEIISKSRSRIMEKVKETRQNFAKAVFALTRSGSGKIVYEHYDRLAEIWGGSTNTVFVFWCWWG